MRCAGRAKESVDMGGKVLMVCLDGWVCVDPNARGCAGRDDLDGSHGGRGEAIRARIDFM